jgi:hypothetical protein
MPDELDAMLETLSGDVLRKVADGFTTDLAYYRPVGLRRRMAEEILRLRGEVARLKAACAATEHEVQQTLGKALGYPPLYPDAEATDSGQVGVGDHVAASLADEAAATIGGLQAALQPFADYALSHADFPACVPLTLEFGRLADASSLTLDHCRQALGLLTAGGDLSSSPAPSDES